MKNPVIILMLLLISGCSVVVSKQPIGLKDHKIEVEAWAGQWMSEGTASSLRVLNADNGLVQLAWVEWKKDKPVLETMTCRILEGRKWLYANVLEITGEEGVDGYYYWARIKKDKNQIVIWPPLPAAFQAAAEESKIKAILEDRKKSADGKTRAETIKLTDAPANIVDLVEGAGATYFDWENPIVLIRLSR